MKISQAAESQSSYTPIYGSAAEDRLVIEVIKEMAAGRVDLIAFTSAPQVHACIDDQL